LARCANSTADSPISLRSVGSAPASSKARTAAVDPYMAAIMSGVDLFGDSASI